MPLNDGQNAPFNLVIFASRETLPTLTSTIATAMNECPPGTVIDVVINGNLELAQACVDWISSAGKPLDLSLSVWRIPVSDKGNAWNEHIHTIWRGGIPAIYVDGYVQVNRPSLERLATQLSVPGTFGSSGVPSIGASAKRLSTAMIQSGGYHGNFCGISREALSVMREALIRLPLGMYRVDSAMGAFLAFGLDNRNNPWNPQRFIPISPDASWRVDAKKWYRPSDILAWVKRRRRQAQGDIENMAVRHHLVDRSLPISSLPEGIGELVRNWSEGNSLVVDCVVRQSARHQAAFRALLNYSLPAKSDRCPALLFGTAE